MSSVDSRQSQSLEPSDYSAGSGFGTLLASHLFMVNGASEWINEWCKRLNRGSGFNCLLRQCKSWARTIIAESERGSNSQFGKVKHAKSRISQWLGLARIVELLELRGAVVNLPA